MNEFTPSKILFLYNKTHGFLGRVIQFSPNNFSGEYMWKSKLV